MKRRTVLQLAAAMLAIPCRALAQTTGKIRRIGVLLVTSRAHSATARILKSFEQGLREAGYVEGRDLVIEWREAEGNLERLPPLAAELLARNVELIVTGNDAAAHAAKKLTSSIPIVFVAATDPVRWGLVKSLSRPGGNVTGFATLGDAATRKQLEQMRELLPQMNRLAILASSEVARGRTMEYIREIAAALRFQLREHDATTEADLEQALRAIENERPEEGLMIGAGTITYLHRKRIGDLALRQRLPTLCPFAEYVEAGGLLSYAFSYSDNYRRAAGYVDKILKGAKPAELPVQQPTTFELVVNLRTARQIGVTIPQSILFRADRLIE